MYCDRYYFKMLRHCYEFERITIYRTLETNLWQNRRFTKTGNHEERKRFWGLLVINYDAN
jgi:hypothetical protein